MEELLRLIEEYEYKNNKNCVSVRIYSDGSVIHNGDNILSFNRINELYNWLKA